MTGSCSAAVVVGDGASKWLVFVLTRSAPGRAFLALLAGGDGLFYKLESFYSTIGT